MKSLFRLRQSLAAAAVVVLAACNAGQYVSPNVGAASSSGLGPTQIVFNHGGRLTAAYSGTFSKDGDCSATATFNFKGNGKAKFLHSSSEQLSVKVYCGSRHAAGSATLTSVQHPGDSITASVSSTDFQLPCHGFTMSYAVTGGTGRFLGASGSGTIVLKQPSRQCTYQKYTDKWSGTLEF
jgi:hypothetical protein